MAADLMRRTGMASFLAGFAIALPALLAAATSAAAEIFPSRPVTMMVGNPPGGPTDTLARIIADAMHGPLGQPVVVETLSGASGTIAAGRVAHARPDGYTIGIGQWSSHVASPAIYPLDYDVLRDLQPISLLAASPLWIIGKEGLPPNTVSELIAWMKARSEPTSFGTVGTGSAAHLCGLYFAQKTGLHLQYVPYRGAGPAMQDLIGGKSTFRAWKRARVSPMCKPRSSKLLRSSASNVGQNRPRRRPCSNPAYPERRSPSGTHCGPPKEHQKRPSIGSMPR